MVCMEGCCICVPLRIACYIIGVYFIVHQSVMLLDYIEGYLVFLHLLEKNDIENLYYIIEIFVSTFGIITGAVILVCTYKEYILGLRVCGCLSGLSTVVKFVSVLFTPTINRPIVLYTANLVVFLYLACVVYSYGTLLEEIRAIPWYYTVALNSIKGRNLQKSQSHTNIHIEENGKNNVQGVPQPLT